MSSDASVNKSDISLKKDRETISNMFDGIAKNYDLLNRLLSFGIDVLWRKKLVRHIKKSGSGNILDLACGTGDLTRALYKKGFVVTGLDISGNMLEVAKKKLSRVGEKAGV
ncbi:MAG: class I SAM-dependent methyltransferase, partial [Bacteroidales bacterium]